MEYRERGGMVAIETIEIPQDLYEILKTLAAEKRLGVRHVVIDVLEAYFEEHPSEPTREVRPVDVSRLLPRLLTDS